MLETDEVEAWLREYLAKMGTSEEEELYMLLTWRDNRNAGPLRLDDLLGAFLLCTSAGMNARFRGQVPQQVPGFFEAHNVSPMEFVMLFDHLREHRDATERRLLIPEHFQLTDAVIEKVLEKVFMKVPKAKESVLAQSVSENDFYRVCFSMDVLDTNGRTGIPRGQIALLFQDILRNMQQKLADREALKKPYRSRKDLPLTDKSPKKGSKGSSGATPATSGSPTAPLVPVCLRHELKGTKEIGLLLEMLWANLPGRPFPTVMDMILNFLERAEQQRDARGVTPVPAA
eukprot:g17728.t1